MIKFVDNYMIKFQMPVDYCEKNYIEYNHYNIYAGKKMYEHENLWFYCYFPLF